MNGARSDVRKPGSTYWLIAKDQSDRVEVLTIECDGEQALPVFSLAEEAEFFLKLGGVGPGWGVRESGAGEIVSVLYGPCVGVRGVVLDPLPEMVAEEAVGLVSLSRKRFVEHLVGRGG